MKVIEKHTDHVAWWAGRKINCYNCRSVLEVEAGDKIAEHTSIGMSYEGLNVECIICNHKIRVWRDDPAKY